jgi:hypothetical protein
MAPMFLGTVDRGALSAFVVEVVRYHSMVR